MRKERLIADAGAALRASGIENGLQEARWLWQGITRALPGQPGNASLDVPPEAQEAFHAWLRRRLAGEPLQYILGSAEFYGLELEVGPGVLIPRPETERLVDFALELSPDTGPACDLCTGSGAIALALARHRPGLGPFWACDLSAEALAYARRNGARLGLEIAFRQGDLWAAIPPGLQFALVTANPPYVSPAAYDALPREVRDHEPRLALWADQDGLALVRRIACESRGRLRPGGILLCEISSEQGPAARDAFLAAGYAPVEVRQDYCRRDRVIAARWPGPVSKSQAVWPP